MPSISKALTEANRNVNSSKGGGACDGGESWVPGWYRFEGAAGTKMATESPGPENCGYQATVFDSANLFKSIGRSTHGSWLKSGHPTEEDVINTGELCRSSYRFSLSKENLINPHEILRY